MSQADQSGGTPFWVSETAGSGRREPFRWTFGSGPAVARSVCAELLAAVEPGTKAFADDRIDEALGDEVAL